MGDKYDETVDLIVYQLARLFFGDTGGTFSPNQALIRAWVEREEIGMAIRALREDGASQSR